MSKEDDPSTLQGIARRALEEAEGAPLPQDDSDSAESAQGASGDVAAVTTTATNTTQLASAAGAGAAQAANTGPASGVSEQQLRGLEERITTTVLDALFQRLGSAGMLPTGSAASTDHQAAAAAPVSTDTTSTAMFRTPSAGPPPAGVPSTSAAVPIAQAARPSSPAASDSEGKSDDADLDDFAHTGPHRLTIGGMTSKRGPPPAVADGERAPRFPVELPPHEQVPRFGDIPVGAVDALAPRHPARRQAARRTTLDAPGGHDREASEAEAIVARSEIAKVKTRALMDRLSKIRLLACNTGDRSLRDLYVWVKKNREVIDNIDKVAGAHAGYAFERLRAKVVENLADPMPEMHRSTRSTSSSWSLFLKPSASASTDADRQRYDFFKHEVEDLLEFESGPKGTRNDYGHRDALNAFLDDFSQRFVLPHQLWLEHLHSRSLERHAAGTALATWIGSWAVVEDEHRTMAQLKMYDDMRVKDVESKLWRFLLTVNDIGFTRDVVINLRLRTFADLVKLVQDGVNPAIVKYLQGGERDLALPMSRAPVVGKDKRATNVRNDLAKIVDARVDARLTQASATQRGGAGGAGAAPSSLMPKQTFPFQGGKTREAAVVNGISQPRHSTLRSSPTTQAHRERRFKNGECLRCKDKDFANHRCDPKKAVCLYCDELVGAPGDDYYHSWAKCPVRLAAGGLLTDDPPKMSRAAKTPAGRPSRGAGRGGKAGRPARPSNRSWAGSSTSASATTSAPAPSPRTVDAEWQSLAQFTGIGISGLIQRVEDGGDLPKEGEGKGIEDTTETRAGAASFDALDTTTAFNGIVPVIRLHLANGQEVQAMADSGAERGTCTLGFAKTLSERDVLDGRFTMIGIHNDEGKVHTKAIVVDILLTRVGAASQESQDLPEYGTVLLTVVDVDGFGSAKVPVMLGSDFLLQTRRDATGRAIRKRGYFKVDRDRNTPDSSALIVNVPVSDTKTAAYRWDVIETDIDSRGAALHFHLSGVPAGWTPGKRAGVNGVDCRRMFSTFTAPNSHPVLSPAELEEELRMPTVEETHAYPTTAPIAGPNHVKFRFDHSVAAGDVIDSDDTAEETGADDDDPACGIARETAPASRADRMGVGSPTPTPESGGRARDPKFENLRKSVKRLDGATAALAEFDPDDHDIVQAACLRGALGPGVRGARQKVVIDEVTALQKKISGVVASLPVDDADVDESTVADDGKIRYKAAEGDVGERIDFSSSQPAYDDCTEPDRDEETLTSDDDIRVHDVGEAETIPSIPQLLPEEDAVVAATEAAAAVVSPNPTTDEQSVKKAVSTSRDPGLMKNRLRMHARVQAAIARLENSQKRVNPVDILDNIERGQHGAVRVALASQPETAKEVSDIISVHAHMRHRTREMNALRIAAVHARRDHIEHGGVSRFSEQQLLPVHAGGFECDDLPARHINAYTKSTSPSDSPHRLGRNQISHPEIASAYQALGRAAAATTEKLRQVGLDESREDDDDVHHAVDEKASEDEFQLGFAVVSRMEFEDYIDNVSADTVTALQEVVWLEQATRDVCGYQASPMAAKAYANALHAVESSVDDKLNERCVAAMKEVEAESGARVFFDESDDHPLGRIDKPDITKGMGRLIESATRWFHDQHKIRGEEGQWLDETLTKMEKWGVIRESNSPVNSRLFTVVKRDDEGKIKGLRIVTDLRDKNRNTVLFSFRLPRLNELFEVLQGKKYLFRVDAPHAYWHLLMPEEDRWSTAFTWLTEKVNRRMEFTRASMGDQNASAVWQRTAEEIFKPLLQSGNVALLMDDAIGGVNTAEELVEIARRIAKCCVESDLRLRVDKCHFGLRRMAALGYVFDEHGRHLHPGRVQALLDMPRPRSAKEVRIFLGHTQFWSSHIPAYVLLARPLSRLCRKGHEFVWRPDVEEKAWRLLCKAVSSDPVVRGFDASQPVSIYTDACNTGIAACLVQCDPRTGLKYLVECWSRAVKGAERHYATQELELLAIRDALRKWHAYLFRDFSIYTDSRNVTWLWKLDKAASASKMGESRAIRWIQELSAWGRRATLHHVPGIHLPSDLPSRVSSWNDELETEADKHGLERFERGQFPFRIVDGDSDPIYRPRSKDKAQQSPATFGYSTRERLPNGLHVTDHAKCRFWGCRSCDPGGTKRAAWVKRMEGLQRGVSNSHAAPDGSGAAGTTVGGRRVSPKRSGKRVGELTSRRVREIIHVPTPNEIRRWQTKELADVISALEEGHTEVARLPGVKLIWIKFGDSSERVVGVFSARSAAILVPPTLRSSVMELVHSQNHSGIAETKRQLQQAYYWPQMDLDIEEFVRACRPCQRGKHSDRRYHVGQHRRELMEPLTHLHLDVYGMLEPSEDGDKFVLAMVDAFSGYGVLEPLKDKSARTIAEAVARRWITNHGVPVQIFTDAGTEFNNGIMRGLTDTLWVDYIAAATGRQRANGTAEAYIKRTSALLKKLCEDYHGLWAARLSAVQFGLNTTINHRTNETPFRVVMGRHPRFVFDVAVPEAQSSRKRDVRLTPEQQGREIATRFADGVALAVAAQRHFLGAGRDIKPGARHSPFAPGDMVWRANPKSAHLAKGTDPHKQIGPYRVVADVSPGGTRDEFRVFNPRTGRYSHLLADDLRPYLRRGRLGSRYTGEDDEETHDTFCYRCGDGGHLNMCETCPRVAHTECAPGSTAEHWSCPDCLQAMSARDESDKRSSRVAGDIVSESEP